MLAVMEDLVRLIPDIAILSVRVVAFELRDCHSVCHAKMTSEA